MNNVNNDSCDSTRDFNQLINTSISMSSYHLHEFSVIYVKLSELIAYEITPEMVSIILSTWYFYQVLITISKKPDFPALKKDLKKLINLQKKIMETIDNNVLHKFQPELNLSLFSNFSTLLRLEKILHRKKGSLFNEQYLLKCAYFELIFIAETLGLQGVAEKNRYLSSELKSFLKIIIAPEGEIDKSKNKSLEYYCQEYSHAKEQDRVKDKINVLIKKCMEFRFNLPVWKELLIVYQDEISPLMLPK